MFRIDIIKTYFYEPNYNFYEKNYDILHILKIFNNNNYILNLYITIFKSEDYRKNKKIKDNYIISSYVNYNKNKISFNKIKNYDNTKIDIDNYYNNYYNNTDLRINNNKIFKKIDKNIFIIYYYKKYCLKAIRHHELFNSKYIYFKKYISYYINYYIIIYNDIKNNNIENRLHCNTIFCNYSRNFMLFI